MNSVANPVDLRIVTDGSVSRVNHNDLEEFEGGILTNPVGVQNSEALEFSTDSLFSDRLKILFVLKTGDSDRARLSVDSTFLDRFLASTSADADSVNNVTLLCAISKSAGLLNS